MFSTLEVEDLPRQHGVLAAPWQPMAAAAAVPPLDRIFRFGRCQVSLARRELTVDGEPRPLQPQPFDVLAYLIEHRERVVRTEELLDTLWPDVFVQPGTVASTLARIRKAIADGNGTEVIRTYHRVGYRFVAPLLLGGTSGRSEALATAARHDRQLQLSVASAFPAPATAGSFDFTQAGASRV